MKSEETMIDKILKSRRFKVAHTGEIYDTKLKQFARRCILAKHFKVSLTNITKSLVLIKDRRTYSVPVKHLTSLGLHPLHRLFIKEIQHHQSVSEGISSIQSAISIGILGSSLELVTAVEAKLMADFYGLSEPMPKSQYVAYFNPKVSEIAEKEYDIHVSHRFSFPITNFLKGDK